MQLKKFFLRAVMAFFLVGILCDQSVRALPFQNLEILVGERRWSIDGRQKGDHSYYQIKQLASIVGLELREQGDVLTVKGPRGRLTVIDGRPLLKFEDHYILLSNPPWRGQRNTWYVTEDFLSKAVPLLVNRRLERLSQGLYRLEKLNENRVQVKVVNYPDHVRVVFESDLSSPARVQEHDKYIEIEFEKYLVRAEFPNEKPDRRFVSSVGFDAGDIYGSFQIFKGEHYHEFRQFTADNPERRIIDVYGPPELVEALKVPGEASSAVSDSTGVLLGADEDKTDVLRKLNRNLVTIDPGHGGDDQGITTSSNGLWTGEVVELVEKNLVLDVATQIREELGRQGYSVMMTRTRDVELPIENRSSVGNYYGSGVFLSIHTGGSPSPEAQGPVVYVHKYSHEDSDRPSGSTRGDGEWPIEPKRDLLLWEEAQREHLTLSLELAEELQRDLNLLWGTQNTVVEIPLGLLVSVAAPAVLIEIGFLTNPQDYQQLQSSEFQASLASKIASSVVRFLQEQPMQNNVEVDIEGKP